MRIEFRVAALVCLGVLPGCAGGGSAVPIEQQVAISGPHQGATLQLPEKKGFVELINDPEPRDRRSNQPTSLVAYFLKMDGKTPLKPAPTDVSFTIDTAAGTRGGRGGNTPSSSQPVPLAHEPKQDDPAGASRFASKPGPYVLDAIRGSLSAKIDGQPVSVTFSGGR
jgi:hypothetical protein